jgi:hypothetical protein
MGAAELALKSPSVTPFSKGDFSSSNFNPSLEKHALSAAEERGRGDFWEE